MPNPFQLVKRLLLPADREIHLEQQLEETQNALRHTQKVFQAQLKETQDALINTQNVLHEFQVSAGLLDKYTAERVERDVTNDSILLVSPPKAAGAYIMNVLLRGLNMEQRWVALGYFGSPDLFKVGHFNKFWQDKGCISFIHTEFNEFNLYLLKQTNLKIILNTRDPRQCINSLVHYNLKHIPQKNDVLHPAQPPIEFADWTFERQVDWQIEHHMENYVNWMTKWLDAVDSREVNGLVVSYDNLVKNEDAFFERILDFYEIPHSKFSRPKMTLDSKVNFRKGDPNEWRNAFTKEQIHKCQTYIPDALMERFGWEE